MLLGKTLTWFDFFSKEKFRCLEIIKVVIETETLATPSKAAWCTFTTTGQPKAS